MKPTILTFIFYAEKDCVRRCQSHRGASSNIVMRALLGALYPSTEKKRRRALFQHQAPRRLSCSNPFQKSGQPVGNLAGLLAGKLAQDLEAIALGDAAPEQPLHQTSERLKRLGRKEGRALKSRQLRYAITPDVHVYVSQKVLNSLNADDIDALAQAFKDALTEDITS